MTQLTSRDLAYCGLFGAAGLVLPVLFHLLHLGHVFMPMYLPLVTLGFFARPMPAAVTAAVTPILSGVLTGMPPFFPPVAFTMALELALMVALIAWMRERFPTLHELFVLIPVLVFGRLVYVASVYIVAQFIDLPAKFLAGVSFISGWPGLILMIVVVPFVARTRRIVDRHRSANERI